MLPLIRLLRKHKFPALPEDVEAARIIAGRDLNGNKGAFNPALHDSQPHGVYARGLVGMVEKMPVLVRQPEDADYEQNEAIEIVI